MASLPADRTKLALAQGNQVPSAVASSTKNINATTEAYDTIDLLNAKVDTHAAAATLPHADGSVVTSKLANLGVTTPKIAPLAVTSDKIAIGAVGVAQLSPAAAVNETVNNALIVALSVDVVQRGINVKNAPYNAAGGGVTDDSTAINSAIISANAAGGGIVILPPSTSYYRILSSIVMKSNVTLMGYGATVKYEATDGYVLQFGDGVSNAHAYGVKLDRNIISADSGSADEQKHAVIFSNASDCTMVECNVINAGGDCVYIGEVASNSTNITVERCVLTKAGRNIISIVGASYCNIINNKISGALGPIVGVGVDIEPNSGDTSIGHKVLGNSITNCNIGVTITSSGATSYGHLFQGNTVYGNGRGMQCSDKRSTYIGNTIINNNWIGLYIINASDCSFMNNVIMNNGLTDTSSGQLSVYTSTNIYLKGNMVTVTDTAAAVGSLYNLYIGAGVVDNIVIDSNILYPTRSGGNVKFIGGTGTKNQHNNYESTGGGGTSSFAGNLYSAQYMQSLFAIFSNATRPSNLEGAFLWNSTSKKMEVNIAGTSTWLPFMLGNSGSTANRPTVGLYDGYPYFDTTLKKQIVYNLTNTAWVEPSLYVGVPASATATGIAGNWSADASYLYICHAANTWKRVAIATW